MRVSSFVSCCVFCIEAVSAKNAQVRLEVLVVVTSHINSSISRVQLDKFGAKAKKYHYIMLFLCAHAFRSSI